MTDSTTLQSPDTTGQLVYKDGIKKWAALPLEERPSEITLRYTYRLRVNPSVAKLLKEVFDSCRFVWNQALGRWQDLWRYEGLSYTYWDASSELTDWRHRFEWLSEQPSIPQQQVLRDLFKAIDAFFDKSNPAGRPKFKKRGSYKTARWTTNGFSITGTGVGIKGDRLSIATRVGRVKIPVVWSRPLPSKPTSVTVYKDDSADWYWASFVVKIPIPDTPLPMTGRTTGLDVGLTTLGTVVDEHMDIENPRHLRRAADDLKRKHRSLSRKTSPRHREAASHTVAKAERKVKNARLDYHHKQARRLLAYYDAVGYEGDLSIKNMMRRAKPKPDPDRPGHYLPNGQSRKRGQNRSIADAGWGQFIFVLALQALKLSKFAIPYPKSGTTQNCSKCGAKAKSRLKLEDRVFICGECGFQAPRDRNSAFNLDPHRRGWTGGAEKVVSNLCSAGCGELATGAQNLPALAVESSQNHHDITESTYLKAPSPKATRKVPSLSYRKRALLL
jgi:putative transposase